MRQIETVVDSLKFAECPRWRDGYLYFDDIPSNRVHRIGADHRLETVCEVERPSGLGFLPDGSLLVISSQACMLYRLGADGLTKFADLSGKGLSSCNDMVTDARGGSYIGGLGADYVTENWDPCPVLYVTADGAVSVAANDFYCPNGLVISPDGKTLIVAETFGFRLTAFDIAEDGLLSGRRIWAEFSSPPLTNLNEIIQSKRGALPDGLAMDRSGAIWMADCRGAGGVLRVAEGGTILETIKVGGDNTVIASALGGADRTSLYMVVGPGIERVMEVMSGSERPCSIMRATVDVPGAGWP